jgi:hypothetical protein
MKRILLSLLAIPVALCAQTTINGGRVIKGIWDASGSIRSLPNRTGTGSPSGRDNCNNPGETYFQTNATPGQNLWVCTAAGTPGAWNQISGGGGGGNVTSVFGRTGAVAAQSGDYTASEVTNAAATNASNTFTAGTQDFHGAAHTLPAVTGLTSARPSTCAIGEMYFATDATAGQNWYYCTAANIWTQQLNTGGVIFDGQKDSRHQLSTAATGYQKRSA